MSAFENHAPLVSIGIYFDKGRVWCAILNYVPVTWSTIAVACRCTIEQRAKECCKQPVGGNWTQCLTKYPAG